MSFSLSDIYSKVSTTKVRSLLTALLVFSLPFERIPSIDVFSVTVRASQLIASALILVSVVPVIQFYKALPRLPRLLLPVFLLSYLMSALMATDLKRAVMILAFTIFVALVGSSIAATFTSNELPRLEKYLYISTTVVLVVGFYQYFGDVFGLSPALTGLRDIYTKEVFGFPRIQSTSLEPLYYGSFLLIPYCLLIAKRLVGKDSRWWEELLLGTIACQLVLTVSRGAIYSAVVTFGLLVLGLLATKRASFRKAVTTLGIILIGVAVALVLTWGASRPVDSKTKKFTATEKTKKLVQQTSNFTSQNDRVRNRKLASQAFKENPVLGIGPGNFSQYAIAKYPKYKKAVPVIVNNEPLELLAEAGVVGFILFILFAGWTWLLVALGYIKNQFTDKNLVYWAPALTVYAVALAIQYQTFSTLYVMHVWVVIGLLMAFGAKTKLATKN